MAITNPDDARWTANARAVLRAAARRALDDQQTATSLLLALDTLTGAAEVWADNPGDPADLSLAGVLPGGIMFGMIARTTTAGGTEWTFHS